MTTENTTPIPVTLEHGTLFAYFDAIDKTGWAYHFDVRDQSRILQKTTLELQVDGNDDDNKLRIVLNSNGTWELTAEVRV